MEWPVGPVPGTNEELLAQYDEYIRRCIIQMKAWSVSPVDLEDLQQQVALKVVQTGFLERWNPQKASIRTYLYRLIRSVVVDDYNYRRRHCWEPQYQTWVVDPALLADETQAGLLILSFSRQRRIAALLDELEAHFRKQSAPKGVGTIFKLLREGRQIKEVAAALGFSQSYVCRQIRWIKDEARRAFGTLAEYGI